MSDNFKEFDNNFEENKGEIKGFDFAENIKENITDSFDEIKNDGAYTKSRDEIIQDEVIKEPEKTAKNDYTPNQNGYQGGYNYSPNMYNNRYNSGYNYYNQPVMQKPVKKNKKKKRFSAATVILASVLAAVIGAVSGVGAFVYYGDIFGTNTVSENGTSQTQNSNVNINIDKTVESVVEAVAEKVSPSVVGIRTTTSVMNFFGGASESTGEGSGVIYSSDGYIITNYHVIESVVEASNNAKIEVFLNNDMEKSYEAKVIGYHISSDLAVIKISATGLPAVTITNSDDLKAGQYVIAIGNPGGLEFMGSVTYGVISGLNRVVSTSTGITLIQTDAAINPGNSGGALLNTSGELIGINSSKIVSEEYEGMGFAIPSNTVVEKCKKIIERKDVSESYVGITISKKYTGEVLNYYGYPVGAVVLSVDEGSPADKIGIRKGDIIVEFDGKAITDYTLFEEYLHDTEPNTTVNIKIYRSGKYYTAELNIAANS